jgi:hypothetical protein
MFSRHRILREVVEDAVFLGGEHHNVTPLIVGAGGELESAWDDVLDLHTARVYGIARRGKVGRWRGKGRVAWASTAATTTVSRDHQ